MNVLVITLRADFGGGPEHVYQLVKSATSVCFHIACPDDVPYIDRYRKLVGSRISLLPHRKFKLKFLHKLVAYARDNGIDVIHSHGKGAGLYARLLSAIIRVPSVHTPHGIHVGEYNALKTRLYKLYENSTSCWVEKILFVSVSEKKQASELGLWQGVDTTIILNGVELIDDEKINSWSVSAREDLRVKKSCFMVAMISRFDYAKNMDEAFNIAKKCPEIYFVWVGDGEDKSLLEAKSKLEGVRNIKYVGFSSNPKYYLAASDLYLSTSRWEGLPLGMLEAMSLGVPALASRVPGNVDLVKEGETGFLYTLGDVDFAVEKLKQLKSDHDLCRKLGQVARSRQQRLFSVKNMADKIVDEYEYIVNI